MNKHFITLLFILSSLFIFAQEQKITHRVLTDKDSLPIFDKNHSSIGFSDSFFYTYTDFANSMTTDQFDSYNKGLTKYNSDIKSFFSPDKKSIITIFPKHTTKGIANFYEFLNSYFQINSFPTIEFKSIKHIQIANQNDVLDNNHGFN